MAVSFAERRGAEEEKSDDDSSVPPPFRKPVRQLEWDENNHFKIMTQIHGSVIPKVIPFCLFNGVTTYAIYELKERGIIDLTSSPSGHKYLAVIMSFLMVSRVKIIYDRYMHSATSLNGILKSCRELAQWTVVLTQTDRSERAKQWRHDVLYAVLVMLRTTMAVLEFQNDPTQLPQLLSQDYNSNNRYGGLSPSNNGDEGQDNVMGISMFSLETTNSRDKDDDNALRLPPEPGQEQQHARSALAHTAADERTLLEEACRAPIVLAFKVRREIVKQRDGSWLDRKRVWYHPCNEEMRLLDYVGDFVQNFHNLRQLLVTPLPFPLVNMAKIFLFLWIFTVPFAVCHFHFKGGVAVPVSIIVLITFGFVGLEYVSIELSDPFGDDPSDFDDLGLAAVCMEDFYLSVYKCDGEKWAKKLHHRIAPSLQKSALEDFQKHYQDNWQTTRGLRRPSTKKS